MPCGVDGGGARVRTLEALAFAFSLRGRPAGVGVGESDFGARSSTASSK
jgi:hypothetical protein